MLQGWSGWGSAAQPIIKPKVWATDFFCSEFCDDFAGDLSIAPEVSDAWQIYSKMISAMVAHTERTMGLEPSEVPTPTMGAAAAETSLAPSSFRPHGAPLPAAVAPTVPPKQLAEDDLTRCAFDSAEIAEKVLPMLRKLQIAVINAEPLFRKYQSYMQWKMHYYLSKLTEDIARIVGSLSEPGDVAILPLQVANMGTEGGGYVMLVEYHNEKQVRVTIINPIPFTLYHPHGVLPSSPSKIRQVVAMPLTLVSRSRLMSESWWSAVMLGAKSLSSEDVFYTHFLSWLTQKTYDGQLSDTWKDGDASGGAVLASPSKSMNTSFWKSLVHALKFLLRRVGLNRLEEKLVRRYVKWFLLQQVQTDLLSVKVLKQSSKFVILAAIRATAASVTRCEAILSTSALHNHRRRLSELMSHVESMRCEDVSSTPLPPQLDVASGWELIQQPESFPLAECLRRVESVEQFAGQAMEQARAVPANLLRLEGRVSTLDEALAALHELTMLITRISVQHATQKNPAHIVACLIAHCFIDVLPVPLGPQSRAQGRECIWSDTPIRYGQQLHLMKRLCELAEYYIAAVMSVEPCIEMDGLRVTVMGVMAAIADAVECVIATDRPSLLSVHYGGADGQQGFAVSSGAYKNQSESFQFVNPEALLARAAVLDYFDERAASVPPNHVMWGWEEGCHKTDEACIRMLRRLCHSEAFVAQAQPSRLLETTQDGPFTVLIRYYPDAEYFRNIHFFFKFLMCNAMPSRQDWLPMWTMNLKFELQEKGFNVYGFDGSQLSTFARPRYPSMAHAQSYTQPHEVFTEDDLLHVKNLSAFDEVMGQRDAELLLSYLTVPYLRIPLVLRFFATEDRVSCTKSLLVQQLLQGALFEPGVFLSRANSRVTPTEVPCTTHGLVATPYGLLLNELCFSPDGVVQPLIRLVELASELDSGTVYNETTTNVILFLIKVVARVTNYVWLSRRIQRGELANVAAFRDIDITPDTAERIDAAFAALQALTKDRLLPMLNSWIREAMQKATDAIRTDDVDKATALASRLHAHVILLLRNTPVEQYSTNFVTHLLSSFTFLTTRYSWTGGTLPELELYGIMQLHRRDVVTFLSQQVPRSLSIAMESIVRIVTGARREGSDNTWGFVAGSDCVGRFCRVDDDVRRKAGVEKGVNELLQTMQQCIRLSQLPPGSLTVAEGLQDVELNVHTLSLTFKNTHLRAIPSEMAQDPSVVAVFTSTVGGRTKLLESMQCAIVEDSINRLWVRLVGQEHDVQLWKTPDLRFPIPNDSSMRFYPDDLAESEGWVHDLFEPIRASYFERSFWDPPIFVVIQEHRLTPDNGVASLVAVDSQSGRKLKEVYVFRDFGVVHLYDVFSYGRRFYRRLVYTSDARFCLCSLHPSIDRRAKLWPSWGRHQAGDPNPDSSTEVPQTCVITRHATHPDNISGSLETFTPSSHLAGVVPSVLLETHQFWQDADDNIRGYPEAAPDGSTPPHILWMHWKETAFDPLGTRNTCLQVFRYPDRRFAPKSSEEAAARSKHIQVGDAIEEDVELATEGARAAIDRATEGTADLDAGMYRQSSAVMEAPTTSRATVEDSTMLLINLMYARRGTPLHSLAQTLARVETLSHVLVWTTKVDYDSSQGKPCTLDLIQLPRLKLSFSAKRSLNGSTYAIYSLDHAQLFISNSRPTLIHSLLQGVPHSLILSDANEQLSVLVPAFAVVRPTITAAPFSAEIVVNRGDAAWIRRLETRYYLYPVHVSLSFMFTPTLASALYLLLLRFFHRNYAEVFRLAGTIGTDMELTAEESQIFAKLPSTEVAPDALACRAKISLFVADSPIDLGWYAPFDVARMIARADHVNVSCLLTQDEERRLLHICNVLEKKMEVIRNLVKRPGVAESAALALHRIREKTSTPLSYAQSQDLRKFYRALSTDLRDTLDVRVSKTDMNRLLLVYDHYAKTPMQPYFRCLMINRLRIVEGEVRSAPQAPYEATLETPPMGKDLRWLFYDDFNALSAHPPGSTARQKNSEGRVMSMSRTWDYFYCGAPCRKSNTCRCRGCGESCGPHQGCPCASCAQYNAAEGHLVRELIPQLDASKSMRTLTFFEAFQWMSELMQRYTTEKRIPDAPYLERNVALSLREPSNSFLRYYELVTGTTKVKIGASDSARDFAEIMFHFSREARNPSAGLGHMMHFVLATPSVHSKLVKYNRTSKQKIEQRTMSIYNSIWTLAMEMRDPQFDLTTMPRVAFSSTLTLTLRARRSTRDASLPLRQTTVLPIPSNTSRDRRYVVAPDWAHLKLLTGEKNVLHTSEEELDRLSTLPLGGVMAAQPQLVEYLKRADQGLPEVDPQLPFRLENHECAHKSVAKSMLERLRNDMAEFAHKENATAEPKLRGLTRIAQSQAYFRGEDPKGLAAVVASLEALSSALQALRMSDQKFVAHAMPVLVRSANFIEQSTNDARGRNSALLSLRRIADLEAYLSLEYLISSLCSSNGETEWQQLNPFLTSETCDALVALMGIAILRANRIGHANRCSETCRELLNLLSQVGEFPSGMSTAQKESLIAGSAASALLKANSLAELLTAPRCYIRDGTNGVKREYDPRFLLYEYTWNLVLRPRQEALILDMHRAITSGTSVVKQMIMGAGKTTVVGPLLALMLADRSRLVIQVVPPSLLDFSRSVLRTTFGSVLQKQIFSFVCDRASDVDSEILQKFEHAKKNRAIVVTTPSSIKSIFLKFIECVDRISDPDHPQRAVEDERESRDLLQCLRMWKESVLIMDEVDLLLHPLKSELNFPIGAKRDIDFTPTRWKLPIHLIDAIFYYHTHRVTTAAKDSPEAHEILREFRTAVQRGIEVNALQEMPHLALLNMEYYETRLKPILARWAVVFLKAQHLATSLSEEDTIRYLLRRPSVTESPDFFARVSAAEPSQLKVLNLAYEWLSCFLPHILQKIDRVAFGIMNADDMRRAREEHPNMPRSRFVTAIPFVGKDLPSQSSEFAHPDVVMGLTILAYRYEGLRSMDFMQILRELHIAVENEVGRYSQRRTNVMFTRWVQASGGRILTNYSYQPSNAAAEGKIKLRKREVMTKEDAERDAEVEEEDMGMQPSESFVVDDEGMKRQRVEVLPLKLLKQANTIEVEKLFRLFRRTAEVIHWYLCEIIFPQYMRHQNAKLSASGQELGGSIMFEQRIGFSGTPSDLLPVELGRCEYERGTDGQLIHTLTNPTVVTYGVVETGWNVRGLLDRIAHTSNPPFHALIDTGALITGMSNLQVARYLLRHGLDHADGVVFLDELDRKMILVRATGRVLKLAECGIPKTRRFAFYDQVHTTGMDIEHAPNAIAVQTLGKDMTFRDFSQGAYRMRGIGQGQTVHLLIIPEVYDLVIRSLASIRSTTQVPPLSERTPQEVLVDITAWLLVNSIRSEHIQHNQLSLQSCANAWRKVAFEHLTSRLSEFVVRQDARPPSAEALGALRFFRENVTFTIAAVVPQPRMFSESLKRFVDDAVAMMSGSGMTLGDDGRGVLSTIMDQARAEDELDNPVVDVQMVQEQEEERDQEQEQEKEQQIEIEKFVDLAYSRDDERPTSWKLETLRDLSRAPQFYRLSDFHLYKRRSLAFPSYIYLSRNYFNTKWSGHRRIRNTVMALEWMPSTSAVRLRDTTSQDYGILDEETSLSQMSRTMSLVTEQANDLSPSIIKDVLGTAFHTVDENNPEWEGVLSSLFDGDGADTMTQRIVQVLRGNRLRGEEDGRYIIAVTLLEAETLRRVIHLRSQEASLLPGSDCAIALYLSPSNFATIDRSVGYLMPRTPYMHATAYQALRFFDCDLHYTDAEFGILLRAVHGNAEKHRQVFFQQVMGCRRRSRQRWERTPVALLFVLRDALRLLHQRVVGLCIRRRLEKLELHLGDAFMAFNHSHSGVLSPDELWGALRFCGLRSVDVHEVLDFLDVADTAHEGTIHYPDFLSVLTGARELEDDADGGGNAPAVADEGRKLPTVVPFGGEALAAAMAQRAAKQREQEIDASKELEVENQRVMDEIEEEQIADELAMVQAAENPVLGETSLTFDFAKAGESPKLVAPYGARVRRGTHEGARCTIMHANSGLRFSLRLLKRLMRRSMAETFAITMELRLPRTTGADKGILTALSKVGGRSLSLLQWSLPVYRFLGFKSGTVPHYEADVFGAVAVKADDDEFAALDRAVRQGKITPAQAVNRRRALEQRRAANSSSNDAAGSTHPIHILREPRPARTTDEAIGEVPPSGFVVATDDKTSNAIDGVTYEWVRVAAPVAGWIVRELNGKSMWERIGTTVSITEKQATVTHGSLGVAGVEVAGVIDETTEEEQQSESNVSRREADDGNPVELTTDVGDLLEALRRAKRLKSGDKVTRNPECWDRDNEDGGAGKVGKVLRVDNDKVEVQWPGGNKGSYHWGHQGRFELVKVGEADSDDEGDMREVMNDDRWLPELRKGGAKCSNCGVMKLEPGNWYRCNHCDTYHLCRKCFRAGHHSDHDFTDMGALGENAHTTDIGPGATVAVKQSITNPRFGWQGVEPGMTGIVLDVDAEDRTATLEMHQTGQEWQCDLGEIELVQATTAEAEDGTAAPTMAYAVILALGEILPLMTTSFPMMSAVVQFARKACLPKFAVGDRVKVNIQRSMCPAEVRAVIPEKKEYTLAVDGLGFRTGIHESNIVLCPIRLGDRVRFSRSIERTNFSSALRDSDRLRAVGTVTRMQPYNSQCIALEIVFEELELTVRALDREVDVVGTGKWTMHLEAPPTTTTEGSSDTARSKFTLPTSSNVLVERAFMDGVPRLSVFIRDDMYDVDLVANAVTRTGRLVGRLTRDPPEAFVLGEERKQIDDGFQHLVTFLVVDGVPSLIVDGKTLPLTMTGCMMPSGGSGEGGKTTAIFPTALLADTPLMALHTTCTADLARQALGMGASAAFPSRHVTRITIDWAPSLSAAAVAEAHAAVEAATAWPCRECRAANPRWVDVCAKCRAPRTVQTTKASDVSGRFRCAPAKSRESAMVRGKLQGKLRAQYQKELDLLDQAMEAMAVASKGEGRKKGVAAGPAPAPKP